MSNLYKAPSDKSIPVTNGDYIRGNIDRSTTSKLSEADPRTFRIPSHGEAILQALNRQRNDGEFCDITILVEHKRFSVHKCVLSASSSYFKTLLSSDSDGVFLRHVTAESFKTILDFLYTSRLHLDSSSVQDILSTAKFLQIKNIISICCRYLESEIENLTKGLDEDEANKSTVVSIDTDISKERKLHTFSTLQQQPRVAYNSQTGIFEQGNNTMPTQRHSTEGHDQPTQQFLFPCHSTSIPPTVSLNHNPVQSQFTKQSFGNFQNSFANCLPHLLTTKSNGFDIDRKSHGFPHERYNGFCSNRPNNSFVAPQTSRFQPIFHSKADHNPPWNNQNYASSFSTSEQKRNMTLSADQNPFNYLASQKQLVSYPKILSTNSRPKCPTQAIRGKARKLNSQARRRVLHSALSDTKSLKFTSDHKKMTSMQSTITPTPSVHCGKNETANGNDSIILLSSAREVKLIHRDKKTKPSSPTETVFDIEAEDRYWDALSSRMHDDREHN